MRRLGTVRVRTTVGATLVVGVALVIGSLALVAGLRRSLTHGVETTARLRASDVVSVLDADTPLTELGVDDEEESAVQVVDARGEVIASSANLAGRGPIADSDDEVSTVDDLRLDEEAETYRVVAEIAHEDRPAGERLVVLVARSLDSVEEGQRSLRAGLAVGVPLLVLLVAGTTWVVTGRALRPVEAIRDEVGSITDDELDRRVPEPAGGDEIARLARTMNEMLARLERASTRQRRFVSDASHELRSPLATIRHELELLVDDPARVDVRPAAEGLLDECLRMQHLVDDLLLLARSAEPGGGPTCAPVDLDDLVLAQATRLRARAEVQVDSTRVSAGQVRGDAGQLGRMVRNLADNAERHAHSSVAFELGTFDEHVRLVVRDDGAGVAAGDRARVFERFTRLDEARARESGGAGLGLAIVAEVASGHGGSVEVDDAPGGGARFTVVLPAAPA